MNKTVIAAPLAAILLPLLAAAGDAPPHSPPLQESAAHRAAVSVAWNDGEAQRTAASFLGSHQAHVDAIASLQQCQTCHGGAVAWALDNMTVGLQPKGPWVGIAVGPTDAVLRSQLRLPEGAGVVVTQVVPEGPAQQAGVEQDDILLSVNGKPIASGEDLDKALQSADPDGPPLTLKLLRAGESVEKQVTPRKEDYLSFVNMVLTGAKPAYRIGVVVRTPDTTLRRQMKLGDAGVVVSEVHAGKPAEAAGIRAGDVLLSANGARLATQEDLTAAVQQAAESPLELELMRGGVALTIAVTPAKEQATATGAMEALWTVSLRPDQTRELLLVRPTDAQVLDAHADPAAATTAPAGDRLAQMAEQIEQLRQAVDALREDLRQRDPGQAIKAK